MRPIIKILAMYCSRSKIVLKVVGGQLREYRNHRTSKESFEDLLILEQLSPFIDEKKMKNKNRDCQIKSHRKESQMMVELEVELTVSWFLAGSQNSTSILIKW